MPDSNASSTDSAYDDAQVFTDHIQIRLTGNSEQDNANLVLKKITRLVKHHIRDLDVKPLHLHGMVNRDKWDEDEYDEIVAQCYAHVFCKKLRYLILKVRQKKSGRTVRHILRDIMF